MFADRNSWSVLCVKVVHTQFNWSEMRNDNVGERWFAAIQVVSDNDTLKAQLRCRPTTTTAKSAKVSSGRQIGWSRCSVFNFYYDMWDMSTHYPIPKIWTNLARTSNVRIVFDYINRPIHIQPQIVFKCRSKRRELFIRTHIFFFGLFI